MRGGFLWSSFRTSLTLGSFRDVWYLTERVALHFFLVSSVFTTHDFSNILTYSSELRRSRCACVGVQSQGESAELLFACACCLLLAVPGAVDSTCRTQCQCWSRAWTCDPLWVFLQRPSEGWPTEILCSINKHNGFSKQEGTLYLKQRLVPFFFFFFFDRHCPHVVPSRNICLFYFKAVLFFRHCA